MTLKMLNGRSFKLVIDESGDKKKGNHTDYVARQYIGNLGKVDNGIVSVNAYGVLGDLTFPLIFLIYKPQKRLSEGDLYKTKPQLAAEISEILLQYGFKFDLVLADSLYGESVGGVGFRPAKLTNPKGESPVFNKVLEKHSLNYVLAVRSNHNKFYLAGQEVRYGAWQGFERKFSDGKVEKRYIQQINPLEQSSITYWRITSDPILLPKNQTWCIKTDLKGDVADQLGNLYGFRNWVEYAFKQCKNELGWADYRLTNYHQIEKWWEIVMSAYFLVSLQAQYRNESNSDTDNGANESEEKLSATEPIDFSKHKRWDFKLGWKATLNYLRLIIQPYVFWNLIKPWLVVFINTNLQLGFKKIIDLMNKFQGYVPIDTG